MDVVVRECASANIMQAGADRRSGAALRLTSCHKTVSDCKAAASESFFKSDCKHAAFKSFSPLVPILIE